MDQPLAANDPQVLVVATDPDPEQILSFFDGNSSVGTPNPNRPILVDFLESKRRVSGTILEQLEVSLGSPLNCFRQSLKMRPELRRSAVHYNSLSVPSRLAC